MTRVLVTRPEAQADGLVERLQSAGIEVICVPTVAILPAPADDLRAAIGRLGTGAWLVVTSANGAAAVGHALGDRRLPAGVRVAAVGPATAAAMREVGHTVDHVPDRYLTAAIADGLGSVAGRRVLLARADAATPDLRQALLDRGAIVEEVVAYRTVEGPTASRDPLRRALERGIDAIAFTSGSTVRGLLALVPRHRRHRVTGIPALCIGPITAQAARQAGFRVAAVAEEHTATGLARDAVQYFALEAP